MNTPQQVMARLVEIEGQLATNQNGLEAAAYDYFGTKREVDVAMAKALLQQDGGTVDERKARALVAVAASDLHTKFQVAEAAYESLKLAQRSLAERASIGQSILRAQREAA